ncbi:SusD/RagB family nutrient-binding outer membrane lipoprotein [Cellulophaga baltica]|uniref:SusD/RagB family nutrient-binding outer membrane lipoprotein n=1 Tax=Cellulophaga baltica TaxID=76594 RepID=UPI002495A7DF|nr:SusD/RagB family nutrient-binding outer membrane lipoprotein [Cellulophaga baltica]
MKKIYKNILLLVSITAIFNSCETVDFGDINEDPNGPTSAVTSQLLTEAQKDISTITTSDTGILYMQHLTEGQYPGDSRYGTLTFSYDNYYTGAIQNLNQIISLNEDESTMEEASAYGDNNNQIATAKLVRAFILHFMTDSWGGLPWEGAFQGIDNAQPTFQTQEELYTILFDEIEESLALIDETASGPHGDLMFSGDMSRWIIFANSLKMTAALRLSDVNATLAQTKFEEVIVSGNYIKSNEDNIEFNYASDDASDSPWQDRFETREDYILSDEMAESLRTNLDPRLFKYAEPSTDSIVSSPAWPDESDAAYVGAPDGAVNGNTVDYSFPTATIIYDPVYPTPVYTAAQTKFSMAEAALRGWSVGTNAESLFEEAITLSMEYWKVESADITAYLSTHTSATMEDIAYEKWVALYLNGPEAWAEWRRLDAPTLTPSEYANDARIPVRYAYDSSVEDNNKTNYDEIIAIQGLDNLHTKLWWDVN